MFENLSTSARIRIAALSVMFAGSLALFVTGVPELPRAVADDSGVPSPGEGGDCDGFCGKSAGLKNVCLNRQCCGEGHSTCRDNEQITLRQVEDYDPDALGTCYVQKPQQVEACAIIPCEPSGASCAAGTCGATGEASSRMISVYEAVGSCKPTL